MVGAMLAVGRGELTAEFLAEQLRVGSQRPPGAGGKPRGWKVADAKVRAGRGCVRHRCMGGKRGILGLARGARTPAPHFYAPASRAPSRRAHRAHRAHRARPRAAQGLLLHSVSYPPEVDDPEARMFPHLPHDAHGRLTLEGQLQLQEEWRAARGMQED